MITLYFGLGLLSVGAVKVSVDGDIIIDLQINDGKQREPLVVPSVGGGGEMKAKNDINRNRVVSGGKMKNHEERERKRKRKKKKAKEQRWGVTAAEVVECVYQYPESSQVEALLSNMMNQLAKVYTRVQDFVTGGGRRGTARFHVINSRNATIFDQTYANMTQEYREMYNNTNWWVPRTSDPCDVQPELKRVWGHLLDSSIQMLRKAVSSSVSHYLASKPVSNRKRTVVENLVQKEMNRVRAAQLNTLCDEFQLCYNELLVHNITNTSTTKHHS